MAGIWYAVIGKSENFYYSTFMLSSKLYSEILNNIEKERGEVVAVREKINNREIEGLMKKVNNLINNFNKGNPVDLEKKLKKTKIYIASRAGKPNKLRTVFKTIIVLLTRLTLLAFSLPFALITEHVS